MSKIKLQAAQEFIREGKADTARNILVALPEDPTAQRWLEKLPKARTPSRITPILLVVILLLVFGVGGFFVGRESLRIEIANALSNAFAGFGSTSTPAPIAQPGEWLETERHRVKFLRLQPNPEFDFTEPPVEGTEYIGLEFEFACPKTEVTCYSGSLDLSLILTDGRTVYEQTFYLSDVPSDDEIVSGTSMTTWRFFEIPVNTTVERIQLRDGLTIVEGLAPN